MARLFDDALSEYLQIDQTVLSAAPLAMAVLFKLDALDMWHSLIQVVNSGVVADDFTLYARADNNKLSFTARNTGVSDGFAITTAAISLNTWHHGCGIEASTTDRRVFLDGGSKGTDVTDVTPASLNRTAIGAFRDSTPGGYMSGMIAEAAIWDLTNWPGATGSDKADAFEKILPSLAKGFTPLHFPLGLKAYWPLIR